MTTGIVFDVKEFSIHDGPGIRTTVFLKGCPLACQWCHNPEGQSSQPQWIRSPAGVRISGRMVTAQELASLLNPQVEILMAGEGGITFSGGEPLLQADFVMEVINLLGEVHICLDTSGFGREVDFTRLVSRSDLVYFDLKLMDPRVHQHYTGCDNELILKNLRTLGKLGKPFVVRIPLVPGITDTDANLEAIAHTVQGMAGLLRIDLLPYNPAAGSKYASAGMVFTPEYDETQPVNLNTAVFEQAGIRVSVA
jgi:pyruvate formate lyase activating enzyme